MPDWDSQRLGLLGPNNGVQAPSWQLAWHATVTSRLGGADIASSAMSAIGRRTHGKCAMCTPPQSYCIVISESIYQSRVNLHRRLSSLPRTGLAPILPPPAF